MEKSQRNYTLDLIRIIATLLIVSVHFFLNIKFYDQTVTGPLMYLMTVLRTTFMACVPMFLMLTGYLMNKKELSLKYYKGIIKTIIIYILASIACFIFKGIYLKESLNIKHLISGITKFSAANYAWYIELYIGLFLVIPFLNLIYKGLKNKTQKQVLIFTLILLTSLPAVINIWNLSSFKFWNVDTGTTKILSEYWVCLWPFTYYFIGAYLSEYKIKISKLLNVILLIVAILIFGSFNYFRSYNNFFVWGDYQQNWALPNVIISFLIFVLLLNVNMNNANDLTKKLLVKVSNLSLGIYLLSFISDTILYDILNKNVPVFLERFKYMPLMIIASFMFSLVMAIVLNFIGKLIEKGINKVIDYASNKFSKKEKEEITSTNT